MRFIRLWTTGFDAFEKRTRLRYKSGTLVLKFKVWKIAKRIDLCIPEIHNTSFGSPWNNIMSAWYLSTAVSRKNGELRQHMNHKLNHAELVVNSIHSAVTFSSSIR
jgi:hypothetical protein